MLGYIRTSDTSQTDPRRPKACTPHLAFYPRTSWLRRGQIVWLFQPWPQLWISHLRVTGPSQSPALLLGQDLRSQAEQGISLCLLQKRF